MQYLRRTLAHFRPQPPAMYRRQPRTRLSFLFAISRSENDMSDLWAYCSTCTRWFYVTGSSSAAHTCPVCQSPSNRAAEQPSA